MSVCIEKVLPVHSDRDHGDLPHDLTSIGQPVIIPGSMGTSSFVLHGTQVAMDRTFGSTCHGAGRIMSRTQAKKNLSGREITANLLKEGIIVRAHSENAIADEVSGCLQTQR